MHALRDGSTSDTLACQGFSEVSAFNDMTLSPIIYSAPHLSVIHSFLTAKECQVTVAAMYLVKN